MNKKKKRISNLKQVYAYSSHSIKNASAFTPYVAHFLIFLLQPNFMYLLHQVYFQEFYAILALDHSE